MMNYLTDLKWTETLSSFDNSEKKILLALSHDKYKWRTRDRLIDVTGLSPETVDEALSHLIADSLIRPSFSKKSDIIFGLRERVDDSDNESLPVISEVGTGTISR